MNKESIHQFLSRVKHVPYWDREPGIIDSELDGLILESSNMKQKILDIIKAHNLIIATINNADMTCNLFRGMEIWHKIACEGAEITSLARSTGIDAVVDMQSGVITVKAVAT